MKVADLFFSSGSAVELPFVYRTDDDGNVNLLDNLRMGAELIGEVGLISSPHILSSPSPPHSASNFCNAAGLPSHPGRLLYFECWRSSAPPCRCYVVLPRSEARN